MYSRSMTDTNKLYLGDCLNVLRDSVPDGSVDLVYIDPPFNSKRDYNMFFDDKEIHTQRVAFEDTWTLKNIQDSLAELHTLKTETVYELLLAFQKAAPHAFPYLVMMALRILEIHRVLKPTGSFYLHCDPTMSHYLKTICDLIFGNNNFLNEIIWKRTSAHSSAKRCGPIHDIILYYAKSDGYTWHDVYQRYDDDYISTFFDSIDENGLRYKRTDLTGAGTRNGETGKPWRGIDVNSKGRHWCVPPAMLDQFDAQGRVHWPKKEGGMPRRKQYPEDLPGIPLQDLWLDIKPLHNLTDERLGYPTQKPKNLLERIINASTKPGDTILDAFCGCGTTVDAAEGLHRCWIGIDISPVAISLIKRRLATSYGDQLSRFEVRGIPEDEQSATRLWQENPFAFQDWWLTELEVFSSTLGTRGPDKGVDGVGMYQVGVDATDAVKVAFSVKGGKVQARDVDALRGVLEKHKCVAGVLLTIEPPTKPMLDIVSGAGFVKAGIEIPRLQVLTLKDYFAKKPLRLPPDNITFKTARQTNKQRQGELF